MSDAVQENTVNHQSNKNKRKQPKAKQQTTTDKRKLKKAFKQLRTEEEVHILMVGLKNAGKGTITRKLRFDVTASYIDMEFKALMYKNICIYVWDVGEDKGPRESHLILGTKGLIFVVDTADRDRVAEARNELHKMLKMDLLKDAVLLVFANKQDQLNAMNKAEITQSLGLSSLPRKVHSRVVMTCATSGEGLYEGLDWLSKKIRDIRERRDEKAYKDEVIRRRELKRRAERLARNYLRILSHH